MEGQKRKRVISQRLLTSPLWATGAKVLPKTQGHSIPTAPVGCWSPVVWAGVREPTLPACWSPVGWAGVREPTLPACWSPVGWAGVREPTLSSLLEPSGLSRSPGAYTSSLLLLSCPQPPPDSLLPLSPEPTLSPPPTLSPQLFCSRWCHKKPESER